ncbi:MAG: putative toxin-antitoxin system toxin component, PIN family [Chitinophagaceae bacterium]
MYRIVIDANVWIKYARSKDIAPLLNRFIAYNFLPVANNYLLSEIFNAVVENLWMKEKTATDTISFIRKMSLMTAENAVYGLSPDPKDNYLFDLAIQNNCVFIISDDTKLLQLALKPIPVHTSRWFLKTFAIEEI